mmetsp:Transcript_34703/g.35402  ORF Transcript_34703/g.35402 Transcript_34703/m.35402 type:complete len:81 (-) Transcript_34703:303-545(-)
MTIKGAAKKLTLVLSRKSNSTPCGKIMILRMYKMNDNASNTDVTNHNTIQIQSGIVNNPKSKPSALHTRVTAENPRAGPK